MKKEAFNNMVIAQMKRCSELLLERGNTYSQFDVDALSAFKKTADIANALEVGGYKGYTGAVIANILFILKQVRDANQKRVGISPASTQATDTLDDMINYIYLMHANEFDQVARVTVMTSNPPIVVEGVTPNANNQAKL
jgi:hypothetical protein